MTTNLELIYDNRTGQKLEIVFLTLNEAIRIQEAVEYYSQYGDVVVLDDVSTDNTTEIAKKFGASIYLRPTKGVIGEAVFAEYVNEYTLSGKCLCLFVDEYIEPKDMALAIEEICNKGNPVMGRRVDWFFGYKLNRISDISPRGFIKGSAFHNTSRLHSSLRLNETYQKEDILIIDVHHLSLESVDLVLQKLNYYVHIEVNQICNSLKPKRKFIRRFILIEPIYLSLLSLWKEKTKRPALVFYIVLRYWLASLIALMVFIEKRYLINIDEQRKKYSKFYE